MKDALSYKSAGVDIDVADATKKEMATSLEPSDARVLNRIGAFASLFDGKFPEYQHPVLVLKMEEPGSKQKLAFAQRNSSKSYVRSICFDMVNHLVNDIAVMGARPMAVQDAIVCGKLEKEVVSEIVRAVADACRAQQCSLVGGETSEQPGVIPAGTYILTASIVGVVEKSLIIDGSRIGAGDEILGVASNGLHTNGYSLVRALLERAPELAEVQVPGQGRTFMDAIMEPHLCYYPALQAACKEPGLHGLAHITGGGIPGNLSRIIPSGLCAHVELNQISLPALFKLIMTRGNVPQDDMLRTFNCGVGLVAVCAKDRSKFFIDHFKTHGFHAFPIGSIREGDTQIRCAGEFRA